MLAPGEELTAITRQNIQARLRAQRMWNWSNSSGGLFLQTGNMSEKAVGYTTIGGDLKGALAVIANVPKTVVMYLLDYLLEQTGFEGIRLVLKKPAGPELAPNQVGEEELMPFPVLDACFYLYAGEKLLPEEMRAALAAMFPELPADRLQGLRGEVRPAVHPVDLQVGAVAALAPRRQPRPRSRARAPAPGGDEPRVERGVPLTETARRSSRAAGARPSAGCGDRGTAFASRAGGARSSASTRGRRRGPRRAAARRTRGPRCGR